LNEAHSLHAAIQPLIEGDYPLDRLEILVVDGGSRDGTRERVHALAEAHPGLDIRLLDNPEGVTPAALNRGIAAARGDVLLRMDGHARPARDYLSACVHALKESRAWVVGGAMVGVGDTAFGRSVALAGRHLLGSGGAAFRQLNPEAREADTVYLGAWPREVFEIVGGFEPSQTRNQDYELCLRIREAGGKVWLDPRIRSTTLTRGSPGALARQYLGYGQGRAATFLRHPGSLKLRQALPALFVAFLFLAPWIWIASPRIGLPNLRLPVIALLAVYPLAVLGATFTLALPRHLESGTALRDVLGLPIVFPCMHLPWGLGFWMGWIEGRLLPSSRRR
jgi:cellulose synthase/poly-beta-1,6-N-acetylglucosamine synthase-like glycosyltransferase